MNTLLSVKKRPVWKIVMQYLFIVLGIMLYCFSWTVFLVPKHIIGGGVVGLATIVYYLTEHNNRNDDRISEPYFIPTGFGSKQHGVFQI